MKDSQPSFSPKTGGPRVRPRTYDLFITHAWRYHAEWTKVCELLDGLPDFKWRNFSLPWHDPAMDANSEVGGAFIRNSLEAQIIPVHAVIFLAGVYAIKSAQRWLDLEVQFARRHYKPILALPALDQSEMPEAVAALCDVTIGWEGQSVRAALERITGSAAGS